MVRLVRQVHQQLTVLDVIIFSLSLTYYLVVQLDLCPSDWIYTILYRVTQVYLATILTVKPPSHVR